VRKVAARMLAELGLEHAELSVHLTDDAGIRRLNREYRDHDCPTDVLAFPLEDGVVILPAGEPVLLGDVVISLATAARQARAGHRSLAAEVGFLLAHGLLHLVGYDHRTARDRRRMETLAARLVERI
jgi:probable rRNA maturation factor